MSDAGSDLCVGEQALPPDSREQVSTCIRTLRSVRRFQRRDVSAAVIEFVLQHATCAGSGSNRQPWRFVVVQDLEIRRRLSEWYRDGWNDLVARGYTASTAQGGTSAQGSTSAQGGTPAQRRLTEAAEHLAFNIADAPVVIVVCFLPVPRNPADIFGGASVYPAVQNLLLAARAIGLGATLTTIQALSNIDVAGTPMGEPRFYLGLKQILQIPEEPVPVAVIPMGWPSEQFGPVRRKPVSRVTFRDQWGWSWDQRLTN